MLTLTPLDSGHSDGYFPPVMSGASCDYVSIYIHVHSNSIIPCLNLCEWTSIIVLFVGDFLFWNSPRWHNVYQIHGSVVPETVNIWPFTHTHHTKSSLVSGCWDIKGGM
jgi:hypothetical protein